MQLFPVPSSGRSQDPVLDGRPCFGVADGERPARVRVRQRGGTDRVADKRRRMLLARLRDTQSPHDMPLVRLMI